MSDNEYMSAARFPLTTQPGITIEQQRMLDSMNYDELNDAEQNGALLTDEEKQILAELTAKRSSR